VSFGNSRPRCGGLLLKINDEYPGLSVQQFANAVFCKRAKKGPARENGFMVRVAQPHIEADQSLMSISVFWVLFLKIV
jgi:hypothetical protein